MFAIRPAGGEALQITKHETGVNTFAWSPDGKTIAYSATEPPAQTMKDRNDRYAPYQVVRRDYEFVHLWTVDVPRIDEDAGGPGTQRTTGKDYTVSSFSWSPESTRIAFGATVNPDLIHGSTSDIYLLERQRQRCSQDRGYARGRTRIRTGRPTARCSSSARFSATRHSESTAGWR